MADTLKQVGVKKPGGVRAPLLPSFTKEQFQNYILRGNADNFEKNEGEESKGEKVMEGDESEDNEKQEETEPMQTFYKLENCDFEKTSAVNNSIDLVITDIPYNVKYSVNVIKGYEAHNLSSPVDFS